MTRNLENKKWYDNKILLILLFFILPPVGVYAMAKHRTDNWKKVLYILPASFFSLFLIVGIIAAIFTDNYKTGLDYYNKKQFVKAYDNFQLVSPSDVNYKDAIAKINILKPIVDSIKNAEEIIKKDQTIEKSNLVSDENSETKVSEDKDRNNIKSQIERELVSFSKGVNVGNGENIEALQFDIALFGAYWKIIEEGELSTDLEVKKLTNQLKAKVVDLQTKGFPILRKKYTAFAKEIMWEHDIDVYSTNNGRTINLTGGIFAANKNIKDTQNTLNENLMLFRFRQAQYRWYKGADEFTYYNIEPPKDTEPVTF